MELLFLLDYQQGMLFRFELPRVGMFGKDLSQHVESLGFNLVDVHYMVTCIDKAFASQDEAHAHVMEYDKRKKLDNFSKHLGDFIMNPKKRD